jgi:DNA-binding transcriptional regulator WhiA
VAKVLKRHGQQLPSPLREAAELRVAHPDTPQAHLARQAGIPPATLQHRIDRVLAFQPR